MNKVFFGVVFLISAFFAGISVSAQKLAARENSKEVNRSNRFEKIPVRFNQTAAFTEGQGVWIEWQTEFESNNLGFAVYRLNGRKLVQVNRGLISGAYLETGTARSSGRKYSFFDANGNANSAYYIEALNLNGQKHSSSRIFTKTIDDLNEVAGVSSESLKSAAKTSEPVTVKDENILPAELQSEVAQNSVQADAARQLWIAAQPGVKIAVKKEGVYRVSRASLQTAGFDVNSQSALWQLYANGNEQAISIGSNDDFIEFYGRGIDTLEADAQIYYLVVGNENGKRIGKTIRNSFGGRVLAGNYAQSVLQKEQFIYSSNILNGDGENFFGSVINNAGTVVSFALSGIDFASVNSTIDIGVQGLTVSPHKTRFILNGHELGLVTGNSRDLSRRNFDVPTSFLVEGLNNLEMIALEGSGDISLFESIKLGFARKFRAQQNRLSFYTQNYRANYLENFTSPNVRVFDVTYPENPVQVSNLIAEQTGGSYRVFLPANRGRVMYAVEDSAIFTPDSITPNQPSTLTTANHNADLLIVTYKDWAAQANDWAAFRRAQGLTVEVVNVEDIFDEFNFGVLSSASIKNFLQFAAANWQTAPKYVLLIGDATYDPKNLSGNGNLDFIPTRLVDTVYTETGSDDWLTDFNGDGLNEIPIGRLPVRNASTVTQLLAKVTAFEQNISTNNLSRGTIFASDLPNGYDFEGLSDRLRQQLPQTVSGFMINRGVADARTKLVAEMNNGRFIVNFSGHGTAADWVDSSFFSKPDATGLTNNNLSIFTMLTCLNGYFINPNPTTASDGLAEVILKANKGGVASWASSGLTTPDIQEVMATRFFNQLGAGNFSRLGDLIKDSKTAVDGGRDVRLSWVLLGDPTLKIK